ncbi:MAG: hypothetical protein NVS2B16_05990 [Chloroflexota bacterium]
MSFKACKRGSVETRSLSVGYFVRCANLETSRQIRDTDPKGSQRRMSRSSNGLHRRHNYHCEQTQNE